MARTLPAAAPRMISLMPDPPVVLDRPQRSLRGLAVDVLDGVQGWGKSLFGNGQAARDEVISAVLCHELSRAVVEAFKGHRSGLSGSCLRTEEREL